MDPLAQHFDTVNMFVSISGQVIMWQSSKEEFRLSICTTEDDRLAKRVPFRPLSLDVSSKESFNIISTWLQQCLSKHKRCRNRDKVNQKLPTRVIDVQHEGQDTFLVETNQRNGNWVALSYCWGSSPTAITTRQNLQQHCIKIPMSALPQTMKDAIVVTRRLRHRYLWIDSLCIIQDSPEDWAVESLKMADVYGGASLTIAAGAGIDTASGIFDSTNVFRRQQCGKFNFSIEGYDPHHLEERGRLCVVNSIDLDPYTFAGCLSKRAWTLQEDLMSRRLITFGKEQLYWRCITQDFLEVCPSREFTQKNHRRGRTSGGNHTDFVRRNMNEKKTKLPSWYGIVNDYINRHITMRKDVLVGISAIAKVMAKEMGQPPAAYKAGLWEHDFHRGLLWRRSYNSRLPLIRPTEYIAPSWSWASVSTSHMSSPRIYDDETNDDGTPPSDAKIIEIIIKNENDDHFGVVKGGYVKLSGPTLEICRHEIPSIFLDCPENAKDEIRMKHPRNLTEEYIMEGNLIANGCKDSHPKALLVSISTFPENHKHSLILQSTESLDVYQRVGCIDISARGGKFQHPDWITREITIM